MLSSHGSNERELEQRAELNKRFFGGDLSHRRDVVRAFGNAVHEQVRLQAG